MLLSLRTFAMILITAVLYGCANNDIVVHVDGLDADIKSLQVEAMLGTRPLQTVVEKNTLGLFVLNLPDGADGDLHLTLWGLGTDQCKRSKGQADINFKLGNTSPTSVVVALQALPKRLCTLTIAIKGDGSVSSQPSLVNCKSGGPCAYDVIADSQLRLTATPGDTSSGYEWSPGTAACPAKSDCYLTITAKTEIQLRFARRVCPLGTTGWCSYPSPLPSATLAAIWGSSGDDIWSIGTLGNSGQILHYDGTTWSLDEATNRLRPGPLVGIWGSAYNDIWAVGSTGIILHYDGSTWKPDERSSTIVLADLIAVWGSSQSDVWAVSTAGIILHYNGQNWSALTSAMNPNQSALRGVWASAPNDAWAVGERGTILHFNGSTWNADVASTTLTMGGNLFGVWGSDKAHVWAVGDGGVLLAYEATAWSTVLSPTSANRLRSLSGSSLADVWAVGDKGFIITHYNGTAWAAQTPTPAPLLLGIWSHSPREAWAVGLQGAILAYQQ